MSVSSEEERRPWFWFEFARWFSSSSMSAGGVTINSWKDGKMTCEVENGKEEGKLMDNTRQKRRGKENDRSKQ